MPRLQFYCKYDLIIIWFWKTCIVFLLQHTLIKIMFWLLYDIWFFTICFGYDRNIFLYIILYIIQNVIITCILFTLSSNYNLFDFSMLFCTVTGLGDLADKSPKTCIVLINELMSQFSYQAKVRKVLNSWSKLFFMLKRNKKLGILYKRLFSPRAVFALGLHLQTVSWILVLNSPR